MITYLLKSVVCSGLLLGVYFLFLEKEKMHRFNRFYLLSAFIVSWLIPLVTFKVPAPKIAEQIQTAVLPAADNIIQTQSTETLMNTDVHQISVNYLPVILWCIYGIITLILLVRFLMNMYQIRKQIVSRKIKKLSDYSLVIIPDNKVSFSFFNYIFPAQSDYANGAMNNDIFLHETVHAKEKHSIDILFIELCKVFLWFNPFMFLYKRAIQLNHEFLADDVVVAQNKNVFNYQRLLLSKITQLPISKLVSSSNYSITKKRFIMMTKKTSRRKSLCLKITTIPMLGLLLIFFAGKKAEAKNIIVNSPGTTYQDTSKEGITQAEFDDYQATMKKAVFKNKNGRTAIYLDKIGGEEGAKKYYNLYQKMSPEQKKKAIPCVPPPPARKKIAPPKAVEDKKINDANSNTFFPTKKLKVKDSAILTEYTIPSNVVFTDSLKHKLVSFDTIINGKKYKLTKVDGYIYAMPGGPKSIWYYGIGTRTKPVNK